MKEARWKTAVKEEAKKGKEGSFIPAIKEHRKLWARIHESCPLIPMPLLSQSKKTVEKYALNQELVFVRFKA